MQYSIREILVLVTFVALFCAHVHGETVDVIWSLGIYAVACVLGGFFASNALIRLVGDIRSAYFEKSVGPLLAVVHWRAVLMDFSSLFLIIVAVVMANYARNEASGLNLILFASPVVAAYFAYRFVFQPAFRRTIH